MWTGLKIGVCNDKVAVCCGLSESLEACKIHPFLLNSYSASTYI